jgi:hypothetical protein
MIFKKIVSPSLSRLFGWIGNAGKKASGSPSARKATAAGSPSSEVAAIAMAIQQEFGGEVYAAIALALHNYLEGAVHDHESFVITIKPSGQSGWNNKSLTLRKSVR